MTIREFLFAKREHLMSLVFFGGFFIDSLLLTRIDVLWSSVVLFAYLFLAGVAVCLSALSQSSFWKGTIGARIFYWIPFVAQFAFGALFSGYFVFYVRSASLASSWVFIVFLGMLFLGNEFFKNHYQRLEFQVNILFIAIFFFATLYTPIVLHKMDSQVFLMSGVASLGIILLFVTLLFLVVPEKIKKIKSGLVVSIGSVFIFINILYFTNIIPPIPLSLKEAGVYHLVERTGSGGYRAEGELTKWYNFFERYHPKIHLIPNEPIYFYSAVFAPTSFNVPIFHEWQYFDDVKNEWKTTDTLQFEVIGGRDGGYRGYSLKMNIFAGEWRVNVITKRGQHVGRTSFTVLEGTATLSVETKILGKL